MTKKKEDSYAKPVLQGYLASSVASLGAMGAGAVMIKNDMKRNSNKINDKVEKTFKAITKKHNLKNVIWVEENLPLVGPAYGPNKTTKGGNVFVNPKHSAEIMAHELGHAIDFQKNVKSKAIYRKYGPIAGLGGALYASSEENLRPYAGAAFAAGAMPTLWQEGKASYIGHRELKALGATAEELSKTKRTLGKFFATYALPVVVGAGTVQYLVNKKDKKDK